VPTFLRSLIQTKAASNPGAEATNRAVGGYRGGGLAGVYPNSGSWDMSQAVKRGYERVIWVYRCVDAIASNSSSVPMIVREFNDITGRKIEDEALDMLFNRRTNPYETAQQFRYRVASQLLLSRRGCFIEIVRNNAGRPIQLHIIENDSCVPIPDPKRYVSGYQVWTLNQGIVILPPEDVIWIRVKPHPTDVYAQMTPLVAAGLASDTDFLARLYNRNFLANDGRPGMLVGVRGQLGVDDARELERRFGGGPNEAGKTTVIEADDIIVQDMSGSPRDIQWLEAVRGSKEDILLAFGTPESVLGNASGRTFDNADAEQEGWWEQTMLPFMDGMAAGYDILTVGGNEDDYFVAHDYDKVDVLQRKKRRDADRAANEVGEGLATIDDYMKVVGREPLNVPGSRVLWVPSGKVPVGRSDADTEAAAKLVPVGQPAAPDAGVAPNEGAGAGGSWTNDAASRAWEMAGKQGRPFERQKPETPDWRSSLPKAPINRKTSSTQRPRGTRMRRQEPV